MTTKTILAIYPTDGGPYHGSGSYFLALAVEVRFRSQASSCGSCNGQSGPVTEFSARTSIFPCHYHSAVVSHSFIYQQRLFI